MRKTKVKSKRQKQKVKAKSKKQKNKPKQAVARSPGGILTNRIKNETIHEHKTNN